MPRRRRYEKIHPLSLSRVERQITLLEIELSRAAESIAPSKPHYEAVYALLDDLRRAVNILNDRSADYHKPYAAPFSRAG